MPFAASALLALRRVLRDFTHDAPPWRARTVRLAATLVMIGAAWALWTAVDGSSGDEPGLDAHSWPFPARFGISYIGGFMVGWILRRFMKLTLLASVSVVALIYLLRHLGLDQGFWSSAVESVNASLASVRAETGALERVVKSSLPSASCAALGGLLGFFYRVREPQAHEQA